MHVPRACVRLLFVVYSNLLSRTALGVHSSPTALTPTTGAGTYGGGGCDGGRGRTTVESWGGTARVPCIPDLSALVVTGVEMLLSDSGGEDEVEEAICVLCMGPSICAARNKISP